MRTWYLVIGLMLVFLAGCATLESMFEDEKEIPLAQVPDAVVTAAKGAVDGITLKEAEIEDEDGQTVYILEGVANGQEYEIEVSAEGKVLEVEQETEDEAKDDD
ncbi:MAG: PepSY domain-containing protein [Phycisphaerales bacterium]|nr:MAG: PepSY domain-containing protein [Phycisphaerales bacterium]